MQFRRFQTDYAPSSPFEQAILANQDIPI